MAVSPDEIDQLLHTSEQIYTAAEVTSTFDRLAAEISAVVAGQNPLVLCVLNGGLIPTARLITRMNFPLQLDYLHATRYENGTRGKELRWIAKSSTTMKDRVVLIVDDILDEGLTLEAVINYCEEEGAKEVMSAVLVEKQHQRRPEHIKATFTGMKVDDRYVFGCGMDYKGYYRNLPEIYAVTD